MTRAVVSREAYGVRGACSRCRMCGAVRKRGQAPSTPYASRGLVPVMPAWGQTRPTIEVHGQGWREGEMRGRFWKLGWNCKNALHTLRAVRFHIGHGCFLFHAISHFGQS